MAARGVKNVASKKYKIYYNNLTKQPFTFLKMVTINAIVVLNKKEN